MSLRDAIARREVAERAGGLVELTVHFAEPLKPAVGGRLLVDAVAATEAKQLGAVPLQSVEVERDLVRVVLGPIDPRTLRADHLLRARGRISPTTALPMAEVMIRQIACALEGAPAGYRLLPSAALIDRDGVVRLLAAPPSIAMLLAPPMADPVDELRASAPEILGGGLGGAPADVYAAGWITFGVLGGWSYRGALSEQEVREAAAERRPPDLPGVLSEVRPAVLDVLASALAASPRDRLGHVADLAEDLGRVLAASQIEPWTPAELGRFCAELPVAHRGATALGDRARRPSALRGRDIQERRCPAPPPPPSVPPPVPAIQPRPLGEIVDRTEDVTLERALEPLGAGSSLPALLVLLAAVLGFGWWITG